MIALNTNLLVYAHRAGVAEHLAAQSAIESAARSALGWGIPGPVLGEFWSVATHPASAGGGSSVEQAAAFVEALLAAGALVSDAQPGLGGRLVGLARRLGVQGPRVFDLQIGLVAMEAGATEIWTRDSGFLAPPGLDVHNPLASPRTPFPTRPPS